MVANRLRRKFEASICDVLKIIRQYSTRSLLGGCLEGRNNQALLNLDTAAVSIVFVGLGRFGTMLNLIFGNWLTWYTIFPLNPAAQVDELAPFGAEGTERIVFPFDGFTAGWAFHGR